MMALAIQGHPSFLLDTRELCEGKAAYTLETIQQLGKENPQETLLFYPRNRFLSMEIDTWYRYAELIDLCEFIIINRGNQEEELKRNLERLESTLQKKLGTTFHFSASTFIPVSSTQVRAALVAGKSIAGMVSPRSKSTSDKHSLYRRREELSD